MNNNKHEFALYVESLSTQTHLQKGAILLLDEPTLVHRVTCIIRFKSKQRFILFDQRYHIQAQLIEVEKKQFSVEVLSVSKNEPLSPSIRFVLPLLKKDALGRAIYSLVELGANEIQLMITQKSQQRWRDHDHVRLHNIMIAAAEQSKNFALPMLHEPQHFEQVIERIEQPVFFFDPQGNDALKIIQNLNKTKLSLMTLMVGPEGDLTHDEKKLLQSKDVMFMKLTPTVLRAQQAVIVGLGLFRSLLLRM